MALEHSCREWDPVVSVPAELLSGDGAGDGNRTRTTSLEGWGSTIELHPRSESVASSVPPSG
jgi:hypothetical protein